MNLRIFLGLLVTSLWNEVHGMPDFIGSRKNDKNEVCETAECKATAEMFKNAINVSVDPCENFYEYACGSWKERNPNPPTSPKWSQFNLVVEELTTNIQGILNSPISDKDTRPVAESKTFFKSCVDLEKMDEKGLKPLVELVDQFGGWPLISGDSWDGSKFKVDEVAGDLRRTLGLSAIVDIQVTRDVKNTDRNIIVLDQPSLFLPRDILLDHKKFPDRIEAYLHLIGNVTQEIRKQTNRPSNAKEANEKIMDLIEFETKLAEAAVSEEDRVDVEKIYNPFKLNQFQNNLSENSEATFNFKTFLDKVFESNKEIKIEAEEEIIVYQPKYMKRILNILSETPVETVANYVQWRLASAVLTESTSAMMEIQFNFEKVMRGLKEAEKREKTCANFDLHSNYYPLGYAVGSKYIEEFFLPEAKHNIEEMVRYLRSAFSELLESADWLDDATRKNAAEKMKMMSQFIGYPDWLTNSTAVTDYYEGLEFSLDTHFENYVALLKWNSKKGLMSLRQPANRDEMESHPVYVNAQYAPEANSITFPAGILMTPFYRHKGPASVNFGGIGVVIGHEITHGFDNQGSQYDAKGNAVDWWSKDIKAKFQQKAQCMIDQYDAFSTPQGHVNGQLTAGENIADNGGLREAFLGYRNWVNEKNGGQEELPLPGLEHLTSDQLFYLGYANVWCQNVVPQMEQMLLMTDVHSPGRFRVIGGLQNSATFAKAWKCPKDSYMNPQDKCVLW